MLNNLDTNLFFDAIFTNARHNSIIIMDVGGTILQINEAFTLGFGYVGEDVQGKNFEMLFTDADRQRQKPEKELAIAKKTRSANDENYLLHKNGTPVWVTGECIAIGTDEVKWLVKIIHNINAAKQLEKFLEEAEEFIDNIFDAVTGTGLVMLDLNLKVVKANQAFREIFKINGQPVTGEKLSVLNDFWNRPDVKKCVREIITQNRSLKECAFDHETPGGTEKFLLDSKTITDNSLAEKRILIVVQKDEPLLN